MHYTSGRTKSFGLSGRIMRLLPVFMHDEQNDAQQNEFICFCPKSYPDVLYLYDDFSPESLSIFRAVCPQKVAKSYQKSSLECLYLFLLAMSQCGYECQIRKKEII